ncbi:hypothetical protein ASG49_08860 [Marmoricola sp. Leaf446]|uniref:LacI family DNA-binding transcriptional regulator n=1 Tax=Marmoricola sp. Leaf446 TaxID=1736379 RepID=UPI0006FA07AB|nr:substrate-binding domain-containing protein [Marmoricola sp. Leaf446]KQT92074.1 hypothetical protein ASG49_08860 [Marmoricola sp. Leaf446]
MTPRAAGGQRPPSMADVAALAGVSHQTVSRVLNDHALVRPETRERVQVAMQQLGYRRNAAARALATNRSGLIGLVAAHLGLHGPGMISVAVQDAAHAAGYAVAQVGLAELDERSLRRDVDRLLDQAVEAVVVAVAQRAALDTVAALDLPVPVVLVQGVVPGQPMAAGIDQGTGGRLATGHLLDVVDRRGAVAHVAGPEDWVEAQMRREGWRAELEARGVAPGPLLEGDWSARSGYEAGLRLAADPDVAGVFVGNDAMALGLLRALHEQGRRVPEDVAVVGFDDAPESAYAWPPLSTVRQDFAALGRRAVDLAVRTLDGEVGATVPLVPPELVVRTSSTPTG